MADWGNTSQGGTTGAVSGLNQRITKVSTTFPEAGTITSISAWLGEVNSTTQQVKFGIFDSSNNLIGETAQYSGSTIGATPALVTMNLLSPVSASASAEYSLGILAESSSTIVTYNFVGNSASNDFSAWPDFADPNSKAFDVGLEYGIYVTYTAGGGDTTAPTFSVAPAVSSISTSGGTATATIDETGDIYYVVVADGDTAPTTTEVIAGQESGGGAPLASGSATSTTTLSDAFSGLSASTAYDVYFVARDDEGSPNVQASVTKVDFTTSAPSPSITNIDTDNDVRAGQTATVTGANFGSNGNVTAGTLGGETITVNSNTDTTVSVTLPSDIDLKLGTTTNQLSLTVGGSPVTLDNVTLSAPTGYTYVDVSSPDTGSEVYTQYAGGTFVTVDQLVYETETTEDSIGISFAADLQFTLDSTPTGDQSLSVYRIAADGTVDVTDTVTFTAPDETAPTVSSVTAITDGYYKDSDDLTFTVNWSESVTVTGTPALNISIGGSARQANYSSGSGTDALVFSYTVQSGDNDADGISITSLTIDGGTIKDAADNDATLTLNSVADTSGIIVDTTAPVISLTGSSTVNVLQDGTYTELGATWTDNVDGSGSATVGGDTVDESTLGEYTVTYNYTDTAGNAATQVTRTVNVVEELPTGDGMITAMVRPMVSNMISSMVN